MERETGIEPATFSLGSGGRFHTFKNLPHFFRYHEPIEPMIYKTRKNLDQTWTKVLQTFVKARKPVYLSGFRASCPHFGPVLVRPLNQNTGPDFRAEGYIDRADALHSRDFGWLGWPLGAAFATHCKNAT